MAVVASMRVYIAAPYPLRDEAIETMHALEARGHTVTSRWLKGMSENTDDEWAREDLQNVRTADALLLLHPEEWNDRGTGGCHVEFGYALAFNKQIVLLGKPSNIFHCLSIVRVIGAVEEL
jgi:hypothetical protein